MRKTIVMIFFLLAAASLFADDVTGREYYLKVLVDSKLTYNVASGPVKDPVSLDLSCAQRDEKKRVVVVDGAKKLVDWNVKPEAQALIDAGEALYAEKKYAEAGEKYRAAGVADPNAITAFLYYGDTLLLGKQDAAAALEQFQRALALDTTLAPGHFFAANALAMLGRTRESQDEVVKALIYRPAYDDLFEVLKDNPRAYGVRRPLRHRFQPPPGLVGKKNGNAVDVSTGANGAWLGYATCKAVWMNEPGFRREHGVTSDAWSMKEERACIANELIAEMNSTRTTLVEKLAKVTGRPVTEADVVSMLPGSLPHIYEVAKKNMLDGYILFEILGQRCPIAMSTLGDAEIAQLERYIREYIVVPAGADSH
jgi:tetratricopeptide (TPR) repeat protein